MPQLKPIFSGTNYSLIVIWYVTSINSLPIITPLPLELHEIAKVLGRPYVHSDPLKMSNHSRLYDQFLIRLVNELN